MDSLFEFLEKSVNANYFTGFGLATTRIIGFPNNNNMRYLFCKQGKILLQESGTCLLVSSPFVWKKL